MSEIEVSWDVTFRFNDQSAMYHAFDGQPEQDEMLNRRSRFDDDDPDSEMLSGVTVSTVERLRFVLNTLTGLNDKMNQRVSAITVGVSIETPLGIAHCQLEWDSWHAPNNYSCGQWTPKHEDKIAMVVAAAQSAHARLDAAVKALEAKNGERG